MAKTAKTQYCYTLKTAVKTPDIEDKSTISDKLEADSVLDAFDAAPSDELLDQLEAEEHAKIMCTYSCPTTDVRKALNNA